MKYSNLFMAIVVILLFSAGEAAAKEAEKTVPWWESDGLVMAGNWEPLCFRVRRGPLMTNYRERYEFEHSRAAVLGLKDAGVNMVLTHLFKSLGSENDSLELAYAKKLVDLCHQNGMYAGAYVGATLFNEMTYQEVPGAEDWIQYNNSGEPILYGSISNYSKQYFRHRVDFTVPSYQEYIKGWVTKAIREYDMDLIHFDNFGSLFPLEAGHTENIHNLFRQYLKDKYNRDQLRERLGITDVSRVLPPRVGREPMREVIDPLIQEWIDFRVDAVTKYAEELSRHIRSLDPNVAVHFNLGPQECKNNPYLFGIDHARLLPLLDIMFSEYADAACYYPADQRLVTKIRTYKMASHFGKPVFAYRNNPLELAETMAFNQMCLGDVGFRVIDRWPDGVDMDDTYRHRSRESYVEAEPLDRAGKEDIWRYIAFFNDNKELFKGREMIAEIGVMRDYNSLVYGGWQPNLATVQAEQLLIQARMPYTPLFEQDWRNLSRYRVVVLAAQENLSNEEIGLLKDYLDGGGSLLVVGTTGKYNEWRRTRVDRDNFWRLLGVDKKLLKMGESASIQAGRGRVYYLPEFENHAGVPDKDDEVYPDYWYLPLNREAFMAGLEFCRGEKELSVTVVTEPYVTAAQYRKGNSIQVHLVNYRLDHKLKNIPVVLSGEAARPRKAVLYSPDHKPIPLNLNPYGSGWSVLVPELDCYAVLEIK